MAQLSEKLSNEPGRPAEMPCGRAGLTWPLHGGRGQAWRDP